MQLQVLAELQPAIRMWQRQRTLDVVGDGFAGGVGKVVQRKNDNMIANSYTAVFTAKSIKIISAHRYHLLVFILSECTWRPLPASATIRPTSWPYFRTVSPAFKSCSAILCP